MTKRTLIEEWWYLEDKDGFRFSMPGNFPGRDGAWWTKESCLWQRFHADRMAPGSGGSHGGSCMDTVRMTYVGRGPFKVFHVRRIRVEKS